MASPAETSRTASLAPGAMVAGRYRVLGSLGEGGMGMVLLAEHAHMHKRVALKLLHPEMTRVPEAVARFEREAVAAAHIDHPHVAGATDFGQLDDGRFFLVLEYVEGLSLRDVLDDAPLAWDRAARIARQIAAALQRAHGLGIVHRDLKPENVMLLDREDAVDFVKVLDFGIAKVPIDQLAPGADGTALTQIGLVYGTPEYMPPEQAVGQEVDARADLYALGVMLHEMLAGERPFEAEDRLAILARQMEGAPPPLPAHVPASIATLVTRLLAKDAAARPASAREVIDALDAALGDAATEGLVAPARRASLTFRAVLGTVRSLDRRQRVAAAGVALFAVLALAFAFRPAAPHGGGARAERAAPVAPRVASSAERAAAEAGGAAALAALVERYPADTDLRRALVRAHLEAKQPAEVVRDVQAWVALDAAAIEDPDARAAVLAAARSEADGFDPAFELMEAGLGKDGPDLLYELSLAKGVPAKVAARALKSVGRADVRAKATPALAIALELRAPTACEPKRALLARARDEADGRSLPYLRAFTSTSGCGFLKLGDCWPCLRRDRALAEAIAEIEKRTAPR